MKIDLDKPVRLLRPFVGSTGNIYQPRDKAYMPGELPPAAYNSYYVITEESFGKPDSGVKVTRTDNSAKQQEVNLNGKEPEDRLNAKSEKIEFTDTFSENNKIPINLVGVEELRQLPNVGLATAQKIESLREDSPFVSFDDLNARVPLSFGKDWATYNVRFDVD